MKHMFYSLTLISATTSAVIFLLLSLKNVSLIYLGRHLYDGISSNDNVDGAINTSNYNVGRKGLNILVFARKRTGSTMTGQFFSKHPNNFFFYEPGRIVAQHFSGIGTENWEKLEDFRPQLLCFLDGIYSCNFTNHEHLLLDLNNTSLYTNRGEYPGSTLTIGSITRYCKSKKNVVTKVLRLYDIFLAAPLLRKHDVKVIHLIRDPRGMIKSRELFRKTTKNSSIPGELHMNQNMKNEVKDYCRWIDTNYLVSRNAPDWFRKNYMLIRYEDIVERPLIFVTKLYEFVGLPIDDTMDGITENILGKKPGNSQAWRKGFTFENVKEIEELCATRIWYMFGYKLVGSPKMLRDNSTSLVVDMELDSYADYSDSGRHRQKRQNIGSPRQSKKNCLLDFRK
ncbi:carbohydrate sulfotransferase 1-like [Glandiceps talaboti]